MPDGSVGQMQPPERQERHIEIDAAISVLDASIGRLEKLYERIVGANADKTGEGCDSAQPSLAVVLDKGSTMITSRAERIDGIRNQIQDVLF